MKKIWLTIIALTLVISAGLGYYWYSQIKVPYDNAVSLFTKAESSVNEKNIILEDEIAKAQKIIDSKEHPLDESTLTELQVSIAEAKQRKRTIPGLPNKIDPVQKETLKLSSPLDYSKEIDTLKKSSIAVTTSIKQLKQVTHPNESFIITKLKDVSLIKDIFAVTEENDPNGNLNKAGGYTAAIFFSSDLVDQSKIFGDNLVDKGTDAGGSIEVYQNVEDANRRNDYLSSFDGSALRAGSHIVIGTVVIRTSDEMTATSQKELENEIIESLTTI